MEDTVLQRFRQFKALFVSSNLPNNVFLEMIESYIGSDNADMAAKDIFVLDGQLSLFDAA